MTACNSTGGTLSLEAVVSIGLNLIPPDQAAICATVQHRICPVVVGSSSLLEVQGLQPLCIAEVAIP